MRGAANLSGGKTTGAVAAVGLFALAESQHVDAEAWYFVLLGYELAHESAEDQAYEQCEDDAEQELQRGRDIGAEDFDVDGDPD
jgi:hypothetical protein